MVNKLEKRLKSFDAYVSMALGLAIVLILGALIFNYTSKPGDKSVSDKDSKTATGKADGLPGGPLPTTYTVKSGDTLWKIAEAYYRSGYNWIDIRDANKLTYADEIHEGNTLTIPNVTPKTITAGDISSAQTEGKAPTSKEYTVKQGDSLWKIALSQYGNGYRWIDIAKTNDLKNPDVIHPGNKLKLP
jgi:putative chitinase